MQTQPCHHSAQTLRDYKTRNEKLSKCPSIAEWINYDTQYSGIQLSNKTGKQLIYATTWLNLKTRWAEEARHKTIYYMEGAPWAKAQGSLGINTTLKKKFFFFCIYLFLRDRETVWAGEGQRERETQIHKQAAGSELSPQSRTRGSNPWTVRSWPEPKSDA